MHHANHFYGHAHILAEYCGLDPEHPPRINGYLQHGWNVVDGLGAGTPYVPGRPIFVYSEQTRRRAWSMGRRQATVVGAPFLYLLTMRPDPTPAPREGTIWYPFHGWEGQHIAGDHQRQVEEIMETERGGPVTFCLYWHEYRNDAVRASYEKYGRVICHGYRGYQWRDTDIDFLDNQLAELRKHKRVASNRLSSAIFHGIAAGCEGAVYGDPMHLDKEHRPTADRIRRSWPELHGKRLDAAAARASAMSELGDGYLASPAELRAMLGWTGYYTAESAHAESRPAEVPA
ncbi:hypothetical protein JIG36_21420 [Actinoplanes sp. LDG1-06]|uniref:Uncharacterized protein n=1 Tax=Paractinoplanes ovalisporus TaxID=2810368 RepID=A0ABS2AE80_9ACTN|nr:hypothetical protein [Actinoplanes ovalisporus]MBM2618121.1 hypothetical protein [Actinoplanes ovalisporus]